MNSDETNLHRIIGDLVSNDRVIVDRIDCRPHSVQFRDDGVLVLGDTAFVDHESDCFGAIHFGVYQSRWRGRLCSKVRRGNMVIWIGIHAE